MKDIQSQVDHRRINIKKVGVKTVSYPVTVRDKAKKEQHTIATLNMYVNLPHRFKGTHMSRFIEILNQFRGKIDLKNFHHILEKMKERLEAEASHLEIEFPYFLNTSYDMASLMVRHYDCAMIGSLADSSDLQLKVKVPVSLPDIESHQSVLPRLSGHWGVAEVTVRFNTFMWIEDLLLHIEKSIDTELTGLTAGRQKALSVEAVTTRIGDCLHDLSEIKSYSICVENLGADYSTFATLVS
jgi:GTP cyclohydrolase IB